MRGVPVVLVVLAAALSGCASTPHALDAAAALSPDDAARAEPTPATSAPPAGAAAPQAAGQVAQVRSSPAAPARLLPTTPGMHRFTIPVEGEPALGLAGVPEGEPTTLLVVVKGWTATLDVVAPLVDEARKAGVLAIAMDFRGPDAAWKIDTAAEDTLAVSVLARAEHPHLERVVLFGYSMGGAASGMALAAAPPGTFTHWIAGAGVMDLNATWREEPTLQPLIENVTGGRPIDVPAEYARRSPISLVEAIAGSGLARAHLVHGAGDLIVPTSHQYLMYDALRAAEVPVTAYTVMTGNGTWACVFIVVCVPQTLPVGPAAHEAGYFGYLRTVLWRTLEGEREPSDPAIHYAVDGITGLRVRTPT